MLPPSLASRSAASVVIPGAALHHTPSESQPHLVQPLRDCRPTCYVHSHTAGQALPAILLLLLLMLLLLIPFSADDRIWTLPTVHMQPQVTCCMWRYQAPSSAVRLPSLPPRYVPSCCSMLTAR
jgi:hypothetical protein